MRAAAHTINQLAQEKKNMKPSHKLFVYEFPQLLVKPSGPLKLTILHGFQQLPDVFLGRLHFLLQAQPVRHGEELRVPAVLQEILIVGLEALQGLLTLPLSQGSEL